MRLFIALQLPEQVKTALADVQSRLGRAHPVRWVAVGGMHLTLQFLGEAGAEQVAPLLAGLAKIEQRPIDLRLDGLGAFPNPRRARVIWAGISGDTAALATLHRAVLAVTAPLGFEPDQRPFRPHLTLGRVRADARPAQLSALGDALASAAPPAALAWQADRPALFQSTLTPRGPIYRRLEFC